MWKNIKIFDITWLHKTNKNIIISDIIYWIYYLSICLSFYRFINLSINITHCFGLGHETMVCAVCLSIFLIYDVAVYTIQPHNYLNIYVSIHLSMHGYKVLSYYYSHWNMKYIFERETFLISLKTHSIACSTYGLYLDYLTSHWYRARRWNGHHWFR